jgi:hypothetical protein
MTPKTILITGARAPVALHIARLLHFAGHRVHLACSIPSPMAMNSVACHAFHLLSSPRFDLDRYYETISDIVRTYAIDLIIPTCEEVFYLAMIKGRVGAEMWCPDIAELSLAHDKFGFIGLVKSLGLAAPETRLIQSGSDLMTCASTADNLVFKPQWSRFATMVLIKPTAQQLRNARPTAQAPWVAQVFVAGEEISTYGFAHQGKLLGLAQYTSLYRAGRGAGICFEIIDDPAVTEFVTRFVAGTQWSGQISFDLIRQTDGTIMPLECNPRATSGLHFFRDPQAFAQAVLSDGPAIMPDVTQTQAVKLAMWVYALPHAIRMGQIAAFRQIYKASQDPLSWVGDPGPIKSQYAALRTIAKIALRDRVSLQAASTRDIEWNGPNQS